MKHSTTWTSGTSVTELRLSGATPVLTQRQAFHRERTIDVSVDDLRCTRDAA